MGAAGGAPPADPHRVARALEWHAKGATLADAAQRAGISESTLKRAKAGMRAVQNHPPAPQEAPFAASTSDGPASPPDPLRGQQRAATSSPGVAALLEEVDAALEDLPNDPEVRIIGAALRMVAEACSEGIDPARIPQLANGVRTLALSIREMRPPPPPAPDLVDERLRDLDAPTRRRIEQYLVAADAALDRRMGALRAWGAAALPPQLAAQLDEHLGGLFAPP